MTKVITTRGGSKIHLTTDEITRDAYGWLVGVATLCKSRYGAADTAEHPLYVNYPMCSRCEKIAAK